MVECLRKLFDVGPCMYVCNQTGVSMPSPLIMNRLYKHRNAKKCSTNLRAGNQLFNAKYSYLQRIHDGGITVPVGWLIYFIV